MLDILAKSDSDFAKDYARKDKTVEEFCKLFYDACSKGRNGGNAVFGSDDLLLGLARHYFHEDDVSELYLEEKAKQNDILLLIKCGDFYETYDDDAEETARILGITLTKRAGVGTRMAGFPYHALDAYLPKLIRAGKRVRIADKDELEKNNKNKTSKTNSY